MTLFWVVAPCSLVEVYQRFRGPCCLHHQGLHTNFNPSAAGGFPRDQMMGKRLPGVSMYKFQDTIK
jgi:hypothetical protein